MENQQFIEDYISELKSYIGSLSKNEQEDIIEFYTEYILDSTPESKSEIVKNLGTPKQLSRKILADYSISFDEESETKTEKVTEKEKKSKKPSNSSMRVIWIIILGLFAIPSAIPLAIGLIGVLIGIFAAIFGLFVGFLGTIIGFVIGGIVAVFTGIFTMFSSLPVGLFYLGTGLIVGTLGLMIAPGVYFVMKALIEAVVKFVKYIGRKFFDKQYYNTKEGQ